MTGPLAQSLILIINTLAGVVIFAILLRFLLQASKADFYNPVSQAIVKGTSPLLRPFQKIIPGYRNFDFAALVLALVISSITTTLMILLAGYALPDIGSIISWSFLGLLSLILDIYFYGLLVSIIASWVAPYSGNPVILLIQQLMEPIQAVFRKVIPPLGGLDFSPIFIFLGIQVIEIMVIGTFARGLRLGGEAARYVIGI
ncbi:MAG: YggT family protein [Pseudohongiellaceae bacterium]